MSITFYFGRKDAPLDDMREVNFSNANAAIIMAALGIQFDYSGTMPGAEFNSRAWAAYAKDDLELGALVRPTVHDGPMIDIGIDLTGIRDRLLRLASEGVHDWVTWG